MNNLKLLEDIGNLTKKDIKIELPDKKILIYKKPKRVSISPLFWRYGLCQRCGRSCNVGFDLFWTENEYLFLLPEELKKKLVPYEIEINGKQRYLWIHRNPRNTPKCDFVQYDEKLAICLIHDFKPIHCALNPVFVDQKKERTILTKRKFGRNFKFGCKIELGPFNYQHFKEWDYKQLWRLKQASDSLGIPTYLDRIIHYFDAVDAKLQKGETPTEPIIL